MKTLPAILITTVLASAPLLVACGEKDDHGHEHDNAAEHSHKQDDHGHKDANEQTHKEGDHVHTEGKAHDHGEDEKHKEEGEHGHEHGDGKDDHAHGDDHGHDHGDHGHAHHGGIVAMVDGVHHELVSTDGKVTVYAEALPAGAAVKARLTLLRGTEKQDIDLTLAAGDEPRFEADLQLQPGDKVVVQIQASEGQSRLARFDIPASE